MRVFSKLNLLLIIFFSFCLIIAPAAQAQKGKDKAKNAVSKKAAKKGKLSSQDKQVVKVFNNWAKQNTKDLQRNKAQAQYFSNSVGCTVPINRAPLEIQGKIIDTYLVNLNGLISVSQQKTNVKYTKALKKIKNPSAQLKRVIKNLDYLNPFEKENVEKIVTPITFCNGVFTWEVNGWNEQIPSELSGLNDLFNKLTTKKYNQQDLAYSKYVSSLEKKGLSKKSVNSLNLLEDEIVTNILVKAFPGNTNI